MRSTLFPPIGLAVAQLPDLSQTCREPVAAFEVSEPAGTLVVSEKLASPASASPTPPSAAVHAIATLSLCHAPSAEAHEIRGATASRASANGENEVTRPQTSIDVTVVGTVDQLPFT